MRRKDFPAPLLSFLRAKLRPHAIPLPPRCLVLSRSAVLCLDWSPLTFTSHKKHHITLASYPPALPSSPRLTSIFPSMPSLSAVAPRPVAPNAVCNQETAELQLLTASRVGVELWVCEKHSRRNSQLKIASRIGVE